MLARRQHQRIVETLLRRAPVVALLGPRQVGKTTLARAIFEAHVGPKRWFDLEDPRTIAQLQEPMLALEPLTGLVVLDEVQHRPELFPSLRVLADRTDVPCRFLILGSASPSLLRQSSESLAGRIAHHELFGFTSTEVGGAASATLWLRGGFPLSFLAESDSLSFEWRREFARTYMERDLPNLGIRVAPTTMRRFWTMLAHYHAQVWNGAELARAFGVGETTVRRYLEHMTSSYLVRVLQPWHENLSKRQVKAPKIYLTDPGLLHVLLDIRDPDQLMSHPKVGASFEGYALQEVITQLALDPTECYFWATHAGAELDLLVARGKERIGFEFKRSDAPKVTPSMRQALEDLKLDKLWVVCATQQRFMLAPRVEAIGIEHLAATHS